MKIDRHLHSGSSQGSYKQTTAVQIWSGDAHGVYVMLIATRCTVLSAGISIKRHRHISMHSSCI